MQQSEGTHLQGNLPPDRLSRLSEASLRINETLEFEQVLQIVVDSARSLTDAVYAGISVINGPNEAPEFITSGFSPELVEQFFTIPEGQQVLLRFSDLTRPLRTTDFFNLIQAWGFVQFELPHGMNVNMSFMAAPIIYQGRNIGHIFVGDKVAATEFTREDEDTLVMFASQAALVISNARKHRQEQKARADLETLVNITPVGVVVFDVSTGEVTTFNQEVARIVRFLSDSETSLTELLRVLAFRRADGREVYLDQLPLSQILHLGETVRGEEMVLQVPDGRSVSVLVNSTPIRSASGDIQSLVVTLQDMAPLKELERLRADFLAMVSHELRTPLTSIRGSATTLLEEGASLDSAEMRQFHRIILDQSDRMRGMISDLLDVARIETGTLSVDPAPIDVFLLIEDATSTFRLGGGLHTINIEASPDLPAVMADRRRIVQVLSNLLSNAARHSHDNTHIGVKAEVQGVHIALSVVDEGQGLPEDRLSTLFQRFSGSAGDQDSASVVDFGLGLAICRGIVEAHGGRIWADSPGPGLGLTFTFTLPVAEPTEAIRPGTRSAIDSRADTGNGQAEVVLAVDDDPQALRYIRDALVKAGYVPLLTGDPEEVMPLIEERRPSLVLLDLKLPGVDGIDLMESIFEADDVPVIFLSAYGQDEFVVRAFDGGASDYIVKPFSPSELGARIRATLRKRALPEHKEPTEPYVLGGLVVDFPQREATLDGQQIRLTRIEYRVLADLAARAGQVVPYDLLQERVWGPNHGTDLRPLRTIVKTLRNRLRDDASQPSFIFTEPRIGYRMAPMKK